MKRVGGEGKGKAGITMVKLGSVKQKKEVMEKKRKLKGRQERIEDDLMWRERQIRWKINEIARREEGKGKNVWREYGKLKVEGKWWRKGFGGRWRRGNNGTG